MGVHNITNFYNNSIQKDRIDTERLNQYYKSTRRHQLYYSEFEIVMN